MAKKSSFKFVGSSSNNVEDHTCITKFKFQELAAATKDFASQSLFGQGEYRRTFKGCLKSSGQKSSSQDVAIRQIDDESIFTIHGYHDPSLISAIQMRVLLHHPNIVDLIGYSINDKDQMFLIYDFMPLGSLKDYLHVLLRNKKPLDWNTRMKIAAGAAKGIKYLHDKSTPPVILRNIKPSDILLSAEYHPKLSDFLGFKERIPDHDESSHTRQSLYWQAVKEFTAVADPLLKGHYPEQGLYQVLSLASQCLQRKIVSWPRMGYVAKVLSNLASEIYDPNAVQIN
ncbi:serine/threonine-protein kinase PBL27-like isoform X1 [Papaver somniferum]|uniref:serine/threonine-protein kinase PBL27-like isoform X1 n=1 Tax=Papaver somniferum TaxID=3469 RepID=UPI000E6FAEBB|nr:serine/threonine-protein kinase PBL27-like isoform X1 [Papaver somniferum]